VTRHKLAPDPAETHNRIDNMSINISFILIVLIVVVPLSLRMFVRLNGSRGALGKLTGKLVCGQLVWQLKAAESWLEWHQ